MSFQTEDKPLDYLPFQGFSVIIKSDVMFDDDQNQRAHEEEGSESGKNIQIF